MKNLLLLLLGLLLIFLLSYYCFKSKTEAIENHLLSSATEINNEKSLEKVVVTVKGEDLNKTRILVLTGVVNSLEAKENAEKIAENIKPTLESSVASLASVLTDKNLTEKSKEPINKIVATCEENLKERLSQEKIHFEYNKALIKESSYTLLDGLIKIVKACSKDILYIEGHTDSKGSTKYNQWLSQKRANAVKAYFVKHGINKENLKALGYGEAHPIATNKTETGKKLNRRIEFKIKGVK